MAEKYGNWINKGSLSEGGQAHIYLVEDETEEHEGSYALKRLKNSDRIERFETEIRAGLTLNHPNIVKVIDYDLNGEKPYMVTKYYEGNTLSHINLEDYSILEKLEIFRQICLAVGYAHENDVTHRDLKPDNIFLEGDLETPIVGDFGICFFNEENDERFTLTDEAVGPREFTAPELEGGRLENIDPTSDVYGLGKILYWLISNGRIVPRERHREEAYDLSRNNDLPYFSLINEYLDKMITERPQERYRNGNDLTSALNILINKIKLNAHVIDINEPQLCTYCGLGYYEIHQSLPDERGYQDWEWADVFGIRHYGKWLFLICENCGNSQIFYLDDNSYYNWIHNAD